MALFVGVVFGAMGDVIIDTQVEIYRRRGSEQKNAMFA
jgi:hypothetical protein